MNSLQLLAECQQRGLISKEAALEISTVRDKLLKEAMKKQAAGFLAKLRRVGISAEKEPGGALRRFWRGFKKGHPTVEGGRTPKRIGEASAWSDVASRMAAYTVLGGLTLVGAAGVGGLMRHSKDKKLRGEIEKSYKQMFNEYPKLNDLDRHKIQRHFGVLARYAPSMAADPMVAGSWVQSNAMMGVVEPSAVKQLADTQAQIDKTHESRALIRPGAFRAGTELAGKSMLMSPLSGKSGD